MTSIVTIPGPHGMESRINYAQLGRVLESKRQQAREEPPDPQSPKAA